MKRQGNIVSSLMSNFDIAENALKTSLESSGSAMEEHAKWSQSLEARLNQLKAAWQGLSQSFLNSNFLKNGIDILTKLVGVLDKLVDRFGTLGTIGLGTGIFALFKNKGSLTSLARYFSFTGQWISNILSSSDTLTGKFKNLGKVAKTTGGDIGRTFTSSLSKAAGIIGIVTAAVGLAINAYINYKEKQAELRQEIIETSDTFLDSADSFEQAYIKYSGRTDLTTEEEAELEAAIQGTVDALDNKSSALKDVVNNSNDYLSSLERIKNAELEEAAEAAKEKKTAAKKELEEAAIGWEGMDGSEVDVRFSTSMSNTGELHDVAKEIGGEFYTLVHSSASGASRQMGFQLDANASIDEIIDYYYMLEEFQAKLLDLGLDDTVEYDNVAKAIGKMSDSIGIYIDSLYDAAKAEYQLANGIPKTVDEYMKMRESILGDMSDMSLDTRISIAGSLDTEYSQYFDLSTAEAQARKFVGLIKGYGNGTIDGSDEIGTVETLLNLRTAVNNHECTVGDYISQYDEVSEMTKGWSDQEKEEFNLAIGFDTDSIKEQYDEVYNYLSNKNLSALDEYENTPEFRLEKDNINKQEIKSFLDNLSESELQAVVNLKTELDWENDSWDNILKQIEEEAELIEAISFSISLDVETEKLDSLNTAITESISGAGLGTEAMSVVESMFSDLDSYDPSKLFERTANGIRLNSDELRKLNDEYKNTNVDGLDKKIDALGERYIQTREELSDLTYGTDEYNQKAKELSAIEEQINATETLMAQYEGLTSAYQTWQRAEAAGNQRDMYESVLSGFETVEDELSRGWLDDSSVEFLRLLKGDKATIIDGKGNKKEIDIATASVEDFKKVWNSLDKTIKHTNYSISDFFTVDDEGNATSKGVYNFLDAIGQMEEEAFGGKDVVKRDKDGNVIAFDFQMVGGNEVIAEALGVSEELVDIMVRAADDAGFVVSMDGTYQQLDVLKEKAQEAANKLKETFKQTEYDFNLETSKLTGKGSLSEQYQEASKIWEKFKKNKNEDGTVNMNVEGAEEAYTLVSTLQSMIDKISEPVYMELDASQVEKDLQSPLGKLQEFETLTQAEHQLQIKGTDTSEIEASKDEILDYFEELDPEIKAKLGIENLTRDEIEEKLEKGEIEIPATVDIQMDMSDDIKDMKLLMMNELGLVSDNEVKLKIGYEINDDLVDKLADEEKEVVIKYIEENEDAWNKLSEEDKEVFIELVASGVDLETLTSDEKKEVIIDFVTENDDEFDKLEDEEKQVVVDLVTDDNALKALEEHGVEIEAFCNIFGVEKVDDLKAKLDGLTDEQILVLAEVLGRVDVEKLKTTVAGLDDKTIQAIAKALGEGDVNGLKTTINGLDDKTVQAIAEAFGYNSVDELNNAIDDLNPKTVQAIAQALGITDVDSLKAAIDRLSDKDVDAVANVSGKDDVNSLKGAIDNLKGKTVTVWASIKKKASSLWDKLTGGGGVDGTAHVDGTAKPTIKRSGRAFKQGNWGTKDSGIALGGEEDPELLVRNGRWHLIGEKGAEFFGYKKGDIIFNASQTKEIFEKGKITHGNGRGKALVSGTAFKGGSTGTGGGFWTNSVTGATYGKSSSSSSSDSKDDFEETIDWIEVAIDRVERAIDKLDLKANSVYKSWSSRNSALSKEISKVGEEISLQEKAADEYLKAANGVGLSSSWAAKVRNGEVDIETIKDEVLKEKISDYQNWYEKALDCKEAIEDLKEKESKLYAQRFENVQSKYDGILQGYEHTETMLNEYISQAEAKGHIISKSYYQALIDNEKANISELQKQQSALIEARDEAVASGKIAKGSEEW